MQRNHRKIINNKELKVNKKPGKVIPLFTREELDLLDLVATIFVNSILNEKSNRLY